MSAISRSMFVMLFAMLAAAALALALTPTLKIADQGPALDLEKLVPEQFGNWVLNTTVIPVTVSPDVQANINRVYSQVLSRTYTNTITGRSIMLSIAYGKEQHDVMAVHYPEICYPAQGFEVTSSRVDQLDTIQGEIPLRRLETNQKKRRYEPITYWTTIGDRISLGGLGKRLIELKYGLNGVIPDGLLFRVSSIDTDSAEAFRDQDKFIRELLQKLTPEQRSRIAGNPAYLSHVTRS